MSMVFVISKSTILPSRLEHTEASYLIEHSSLFPLRLEDNPQLNQHADFGQSLRCVPAPVLLC